VPLPALDDAPGLEFRLSQARVTLTQCPRPRPASLLMVELCRHIVASKAPDGLTRSSIRALRACARSLRISRSTTHRSQYTRRPTAQNTSSQSGDRQGSVRPNQLRGDRAAVFGRPAASNRGSSARLRSVCTWRSLVSHDVRVMTFRNAEAFLPESNIVDRHIRSPRIKLQNDYRNPRFIATVPGKGYRFIPTFTNQGWNPAPSPEEAGTGPARSRSDAG
jgi:Transcriptional regulatory protein, C terminal